MSNKAAVSCNRCGKVMYLAPWQVARSDVHYCSKACHNPPTTIRCEHCGKEKRVPPSAIKEHNFCSRKCCRAWQQTQGITGVPWARVVVACDICGKQFERERNAVGGRNYCGKECFYRAHRANMAGDKNPAWRGGYDPYYGPNWDRQARRARERDGHRCQRCGVDESALHCSLHVHHIKPLRAFQRDFRRANSLENLVSLCPSCHKHLEWHQDLLDEFVATWFATRQPAS